MNANEILEILRQSLSNRRIDLPRDMDFSLSCGTLDILMTAEGLLSNMQENASAFESWALCIKAALPQIDRVTVGWNAPARPDSHYNRFVYRAVRFEENYSWVTLRIPDDSITAAALADIVSNTLILNHPVADAKALASDSSSEAARERDLLSLMAGRHPDSIVGQQLPAPGQFTQTQLLCRDRSAEHAESSVPGTHFEIAGQFPLLHGALELHVERGEGAFETGVQSDVSGVVEDSGQ